MQNNKILSTVDLQAIIVEDKGEPLVNLASQGIICDYRRDDALVRSVFVRQTVAYKLQKVQERLNQFDSRMHLLVVEGYRSPFYQEGYFLQQMLIEFQRDPSLPFSQLIEAVHQYVALPSVAGHPTGGAVDLTIAFEGQEIDMGGQIADFSTPEKLPTFSSLVTSEQAERRLLLHKNMLAEGFAPFYGEWWHFSYGDREWAALYETPKALYGPLYQFISGDQINGK